MVFKKPFAIKTKYEMKDTPSNYRRYPGGKEMPDQVKVWPVQKMPERMLSGQVYGPSSLVDAQHVESLVTGFNTGKGPRAVGVGRFDNLLQWGYDGMPGDMTDAGKKLFLNCIVYISKYDPKTMGQKK